MLYEDMRLLFRAMKFRLKRDRRELAWILSQIGPGDCALDIGSHKGGYTYWMARRVGPGGLIIGFEPQPALAERMRNLWTWRGTTQVRLEQMALSDKPGTATLHLPQHRNSPLATLEAGVLGSESDTVTVAVDTLDNYAMGRSLPRVRLIKCDVEGHELSVFKGGRELLTRDKPALIFECEAKLRGEKHIREVFAFLEGLGYTGSFFDAGGRLTPVAQFDAARHQQSGDVDYVKNCVFVPAA